MTPKSTRGADEKPERLGTIQEAAARVRVHPRSIRRYIDQGLITGYRSGPHLLRVDLDEVERVLIRRVPAAAAPAQDGAA